MSDNKSKISKIKSHQTEFKKPDGYKNINHSVPINIQPINNYIQPTHILHKTLL